MFLTHTDAVVGDLALSRSYNSGRISTSLATRYGMFGPGWNSSLESRLVFTAPNTITARNASGDPTHYFDGNADGIYEAQLPYTKESWLQTISGGYKLLHRAGGYETYDAAGRFQTAVDAAGVTTTYSRDGENRLTSVTRLGRSITLVYDGSSNQPARVEGPGGLTLASYVYNEQTGFLERVTYGDGSGYRYAYDGFARILSVTDHAGKSIETHQYDGYGRATTSELGGGQEKLTLAYNWGQTTVTDALGNVTIYDFENIHGMNRVTKVTGPCPSCGGGGGNSQEWIYDESGNVTSYENGLGKVWSYTYSADNDLLTETNPLSEVTTYTYDTEGRVLTRTGADGSETTYTHGPAGPLTMTEKVTPTHSRTTTITYYGVGKPEVITDPRNKITTLGYNGNADLTTITDPLNHVTSFGYDDFGRRTSVTDALNHTTTTTYDSLGHVTRITNHDGGACQRL